MAEYIEREAVFAGVEKRIKNPAIVRWLESIVADVPAADVAPVVHGRRVASLTGFDVCSECHKVYTDGWFTANGIKAREQFNYCPNCGARMIEEDE